MHTQFIDVWYLPQVWPKNVGPSNWFVNWLVVWFFRDDQLLDIASSWQANLSLQMAWPSQTWKSAKQPAVFEAHCKSRREPSCHYHRSSNLGKMGSLPFFFPPFLHELDVCVCVHMFASCSPTYTHYIYHTYIYIYIIHTLYINVYNVYHVYIYIYVYIVLYNVD